MPQENQIEKIEQYHSGNMSPEEAASFEKELASDPALRAESDFQSEIINGIKEYRKTQLKTRLDAIDVSPGWMEFAQQSALVKSFGGIAIATAIGSGVYFLAETKKVPQMDEAATIESISEMTVPVEHSFDWSIPELSAKNVEVEKIVAAKRQSVAVEEVQQAQETKQETKAVSQNTSQVAKEKQEESFTPNINAPDAQDVSDNAEISATTLDEVPVISSTEGESDPIEVETRNTKSSKIKYKYYDGKLYLNGNFSKEPYEILEINSAKGRRIYLLHLNKYYEVRINDRLSELPEVTDVKLIRELRLIKANK